jgi:hypothetical protein
MEFGEMISGGRSSAAVVTLKTDDFKLSLTHRRAWVYSHIFCLGRRGLGLGSCRCVRSVYTEV